MFKIVLAALTLVRQLPGLPGLFRRPCIVMISGEQRRERKQWQPNLGKVIAIGSVSAGREDCVRSQTCFYVTCKQCAESAHACTIPLVPEPS